MALVSKPGIENALSRLDSLVRDLKAGQSFPVTRLTVIKTLCADSKASSAFALFLMRQVSGKRKPKILRACRQADNYLKRPTARKRCELWDLLSEIQSRQNEYKPLKWGSVRIIHDMPLLIVEHALRCILSNDDAPYWAYHAARRFAERYDSRYGDGLTPSSAPYVRKIRDFWFRFRRHWPKPDLLSICRSPDFVEAHLARKLLRRISK